MPLNCKSFKLTLGLLILFIPNLSFGSLSYQEQLEYRLKFCSGIPGQIAEARRGLDRVLEETPDDVQAYDLRNFFVPEDTNRTMEGLARKIANNESPASELERVMFASARLLMRTMDLKAYKENLNFKAKNPEIEAFRLDLLATAEELQDNVESAFDILLDALAISPDFDPLLLEHALLVEPDRITTEKRKLLEPYLRKITTLDGRDPIKALLEGLAGEWNGSLTGRQIHTKILQAYQSCRTDSNITLEYALRSGKNGDFQNQYDTLKGILSSYKYHPPATEFFFSVAATRLKKSDEARHYLQLVKSSYLMNSPVFRQSIQRWEESQGERRFQSILGWLIVALVLAAGVLLAVLFRRKSRHDKTASAPILPCPAIDHAALEAAERDLGKEDPGQFETVLTCGPEQGFQESSIMEIVAYLNSNGVDAMFVPGANLFSPSFTIQAPAGQVAEARALLERYFQKVPS